MNTKEKLENELKDAMRSGDEVKKRTIRMALAAIKMAEVEKGKPVDESSILAILQKEIKGRKEAILDAEKAGRSDLVAENFSEMKILEVFLPTPLTQAELQELARAAIQEVGASTQADMGKVMKVLVPRLEGRAPGDQASQVVRQLLQAN
jgi:uncharacterized protein YqeY